MTASEPLSISSATPFTGIWRDNISKFTTPLYPHPLTTLTNSHITDRSLRIFFLLPSSIAIAKTTVEIFVFLWYVPDHVIQKCAPFSSLGTELRCFKESAWDLHVFQSSMAELFRASAREANIVVLEFTWQPLAHHDRSFFFDYKTMGKQNISLQGSWYLEAMHIPCLHGSSVLVSIRTHESLQVFCSTKARQRYGSSLGCLYACIKYYRPPSKCQDSIVLGSAYFVRVYLHDGICSCWLTFSKPRTAIWEQHEGSGYEH